MTSPCLLWGVHLEWHGGSDGKPPADIAIGRDERGDLSALASREAVKARGIVDVAALAAAEAGAVG